MSARSYADKLRLPQWTKRKATILTRAHYACEHCGDANSPLQIHHKVYHRGHEPWEYEDWELECLCENCHKVVEDAKARFLRRLAELPGHTFISLELALEALAAADFADFPSALRVWCWGAGDRQIFDETLRRIEEGQANG